MNANSTLIETLQRSEVYQRYAAAYTEATGLPVTLRAMETGQIPLHGKPHENRFCAIVAMTNRACAKCLQMQRRLAQRAEVNPFTMVCPYGLYEVAVPIKTGTQTIALLQTGQVLRKKPTEAMFNRIMSHAAKSGLEIKTTTAREAYFQTPVVSRKKLDSVAELLRIFAEHLSIKCNQLAIQQANQESPVIARARKFIEERHAEDISLNEVAKAVNTSIFYFCKLFHKETGLTFTEFLCRTRVENARNFLLNPHLRISEIAYQAGFRSLTHFNRMFKTIVGQSPTDYRKSLATAGLLRKHNPIA